MKLTLKELRCPNCGARLEYPNKWARAIHCDYCRSNFLFFRSNRDIEYEGEEASSFGISSEEACEAVQRLTIKKTDWDIAYEVIEGKWGNGEERKWMLTRAGYDYYSVQEKVNLIIYGSM